MEFKEALHTVLVKKYFTIKGRASRTEYWYWVLFCVALGMGLGVIDVLVLGLPAGKPSMLTFLVQVALLIPNITVNARRLHDINKSGWWMLIALTIIGIVPLFFWLIQKSDIGPNKYGNPPV